MDDQKRNALLWEVGKLALQQFMVYARMAGRSTEEIKAAFDESSARMDARPASGLTPPPPT